MVRTILLLFFSFNVFAEDARGFWFINVSNTEAVIIAKSKKWPWAPDIVSVTPMFDEFYDCEKSSVESDIIARPFIYSTSDLDVFYVWIIKQSQMECLKASIVMSVSYVASEKNENIDLSFQTRNPPSSNELKKAGAPKGTVSAELRFPFAKDENIDFVWLRGQPRISIIQSSGVVSAILPGVSVNDIDVSCFDNFGGMLNPNKKDSIISNDIKFMSLEFSGGAIIKKCKLIRNKTT